MFDDGFYQLLDFFALGCYILQLLVSVFQTSNEFETRCSLSSVHACSTEAAVQLILLIWTANKSCLNVTAVRMAGSSWMQPDSLTIQVALCDAAELFKGETVSVSFEDQVRTAQ